MKLSAKIRYALAATTRMAQLGAEQESVTVISLAKDLDISKIYLEQIFSSLKRAGIVLSIKGARGGYLLARAPQEISIFDVMRAIETSLFAENPETVANKAPEIDAALHAVVFARLDEAITNALKNISLATLVAEAESHGDNYMYYL